MKKILGILVCVWLSVLSVASAYQIGDTGPGGGKIFLTPTTNGNTTGMYFEAAPVDVSYNYSYVFVWATTNYLIGTNTTIGQGSANTNAIVAWLNANAQSGMAAQVADAYTAGGKSDWFLPSLDELNAMYVQKGIIGGFLGNGYWSSSEFNIGESWGEGFYSGELFRANKPNAMAVRPVRAFLPITEYAYSAAGDIVTYKRQTLEEVEICRIVMSKALTGLALAEGDVTSSITMGKTVEGKPMVAVTGSLAEEINSANAIAPKSVWVTASFTVDGLYPIILNGEQMSDSKGNVFPQYANYLGDITYNAGEMTFRIYHFSEWSIPQLEAKTFTGTADTDEVVANGASIIIMTGATQHATGDGNHTSTIPVDWIAGLAYETVLCDVPGVGGGLYKPMNPATTDNAIHFGYISRGNMPVGTGISVTSLDQAADHFGYTIVSDNKTVDPWQIASFSIVVTNSTATAFERATLNVSVSLLATSAVSYNAFSGAISKTYGDDGVYGGTENATYVFTFETEGYSLKVLDRVATINSPLSDGQFIPGAKVKYEIVVQNQSSAEATDVALKDIIPPGTHLFYSDNPTVDGAVSWILESVTDNASATEVAYKITIPANGTVTASYTVTVD